MPWTIAHAAAVLPLRRKAGARLSFAGLCIGSFSPDFGYYLPFIAGDGIAHTPLGIALVCVPSGLVLWVLLRWLHAPMAELLPQPHRAALLALPRVAPLSSPRAWVVAAWSIALGALTHIVWDAFTHAHGLFVAHSEALRAPLLQVLGRSVPTYAVLQHLSTLVGTACVVLAYTRYLRGQASTDSAARGERLRKLGLAALLGAAMAGAAPIAWAQAGGAQGAVNATLLVVRWVIWTTTLLAAGLLAVALVRRSLQSRACAS